MQQKKLIQTLNKILSKKNYHIFFLILSSFSFTFYYGYVGVFPIDSFLIYDAGYKILNGYHPFKDYWSITGPILDYIQLLFFKIFGVNWFSYVMHAAVINFLLTIVFFYFFTQLNIKPIYSFLYSLSAAILAYPSVGTPFMDHHAAIFSTISGIFLFLAFLKNKTVCWFLVPIFLAASFLSKQIPSAYLLILFLIFILSYGILFSSKNLKFLIFLIGGTLLSIIIFTLVFLINDLPFNNFLIQYIYHPLELGQSRGSEINFDMNNVFLQFKFIYFALIPLVIVLIKLFKKKINLDIKKDYFLIIFYLLVVSLFILSQLLTKNQILIFFLIPLSLGISHYFSIKYNNKKIVLIFLVTILFISTVKFHLRFNENKKFMELSNTNLELSINAKKVDESLKGLKWITPNNLSPEDEIEYLINIINIISSDSSKKIIITDYQILPSILDLKTTAPNKWFDDLSVLNENNKYFKEYKNFFIKNLKNQKIETIYIFKKKEKYLNNLFENKCFLKDNIYENFFKLNIKKCIN